MMRNYLCLILLLIPTFFQVQAQSRKEIRIPNVLGYQTLKCDFHMHTVFSDGEVWPTVRVEEAWAEGLDAIAITDHLEYQPHMSELNNNHNRAYEVAKPLADQLGLMLVAGAEISRNMPPGHLNALFIKNANLLERENWWDACVEAKEQGGIIVWNHPGWKAQQPDETIWWPEHTQLLDNGLLNGIEIYNNNEYYPEALQWASEKNLALLCNSDLHSPSDKANTSGTQMRPLTLVFATERNQKALKEAVANNRTAALFNDTLIAERQYLTPIFLKSIQLKTQKLLLKNQEVKYLQIYNNSDIPFHLVQRQPSVGFNSPEQITLPPNRTVSIELTGISDEVGQMPVLKMFYEATNLITKRGERLPVNIDVPNL